MKTRILIADDHAIVRDGVRALLVAAGDFRRRRRGLGRSAGDRPGRLARAGSHPDGHRHAGLGGLEATLEIRKRVPRAKIIVLSQYGDTEYVRRFVKAGVSGYVLKNAAGADLVAAVRAVLRGGLVLDPEIARDALSGPGTPAEPTCRTPTTRSRTARNRS
jgi:DNA-binding NarL/FixJ family response regulator